MPHDPRKHCCWCGQQLTPENRVTHEKGGHTYYFDREACKRAFIEDPNETNGEEEI